MATTESHNFRRALAEIIFFIALFDIGFLRFNAFLYIRCIFALYLLYVGYTCWKKKVMEYRLCVAMSTCVIISCLASNILNSQSIIRTFVASLPFFQLVAFAIPYKYNLSFDQTRKILVWLSFLFCLFYLLQWMVYPKTIFPMATAFGSDEVGGYYRSRMAGSACCYFMLMYGWNKFIISKHKTKYLCMMVLGFLPIIIQGFRSLTILSLIALILMIFYAAKRGSQKILYTMSICTLALFAISSVEIVGEKIEEMTARQEDNQSFENDDYIRNLSLAYYTGATLQNPVQLVTGGGTPLESESSAYSRIFTRGASYGFFWVDLGLICLSYIIGIPAVLLLIWLCIRIMRKCKDPSIQYLRFTVFIIFLGSIATSKEIFREENLVFLALYAYAEWKFRQEKESADSPQAAKLIQ